MSLTINTITFVKNNLTIIINPEPPVPPSDVFDLYFWTSNLSASVANVPNVLVEGKYPPQLLMSDVSSIAIFDGLSPYSTNGFMAIKNGEFFAFALGDVPVTYSGKPSSYTITTVPEAPFTNLKTVKSFSGLSGYDKRRTFVFDENRNVYALTTFGFTYPGFKLQSNFSYTTMYPSFVMLGRDACRVAENTTTQGFAFSDKYVIRSVETPIIDGQQIRICLKGNANNLTETSYIKTKTYIGIADGSTLNFASTPVVVTFNGQSILNMTANNIYNSSDAINLNYTTADTILISTEVELINSTNILADMSIASTSSSIIDTKATNIESGIKTYSNFTLDGNTIPSYSIDKLVYLINRSSDSSLGYYNRSSKFYGNYTEYFEESGWSYITVNLGTTKTFNRIHLKNASDSYAASAITIDTSATNITWDSAGWVNELAETAIANGISELNFTDITSQYIRIGIKNATGESWVRMYEIKIFDSADEISFSPTGTEVSDLTFGSLLPNMDYRTISLTTQFIGTDTSLKLDDIYALNGPATKWLIGIDNVDKKLYRWGNSNFKEVTEFPRQNDSSKFSISGSTLTLTNPIPLGTTTVEVLYGSTTDTFVETTDFIPGTTTELTLTGSPAFNTITIKYDSVIVFKFYWKSAHLDYDGLFLLRSDDTIWDVDESNNYTQIGSDTWLHICRSEDSGYAAICAIKSDGTLWTWGYFTEYSSGNGISSGNIYRSSMFQVGTDTDWTECWTNGFITAAVKSNGSMYAMGNNGYGNCGTNSNDSNVTSLQLVGSYSSVVSLSIDSQSSTIYANNLGYYYCGYIGKTTVKVPTAIANNPYIYHSGHGGNCLLGK